MRAVWAASFVTSAFLGGCLHPTSVVRVDRGDTTVGRWIAPEAYAAFLDASLLEERGDLPGAKAAFRRVLREDPDAAEAWAHLGKLSCLEAPADADSAFERARRTGADIPTVSAAEADCALRRAHPERAKQLAYRALSLDPLNPGLTRFYASVLDRTGDRTRAAAIRRAWAVRWRTPLTPVPPDQDLFSVLRPVEPASSEAAARTEAPTPVDPVRNAVWRRLRAEPEDVDAHIRACVLSDLARDEATFRQALAIPVTAGTPSAEAAREMADLLSRRVGEAARDAWTAAYQSTSTP